MLYGEVGDIYWAEFELVSGVEQTSVIEETNRDFRSCHRVANRVRSFIDTERPINASDS